MITRTNWIDRDEVEGECNAMEEAGWSVRQIVPTFFEGCTFSFFVVFEREVD